MIISHSQRFIFIHIFKTAGTTISDELLPYSRLIDRITYQYYLSKKIITLVERVFHLQDEGQAFITGFHKHATAKQIASKIGAEHYEQYFTFCFVRNPYDHMVSLYHYILDNKRHRLHILAKHGTFGDFVSRYISLLPQTQTEFVFDGKRQLVKFVGRYECMREDMNRIFNHLGIEQRKLGHLNRSNRRRDFLGYFNDEALLLSFNKYFADDFKNFGYTVIDKLSE